MSLFDSELWPVVGIPALIFVARVLDVSLGTLRIVFISRGLRKVAPFIGFFEILIWLLAIGQVVQHLDRPLNYLVYAGGFATGTWVGLLLEGKLALGYATVRIITAEDAAELMAELGREHFGVTSFAARGLRGRVRLIFTVIRRRDLRRLLDRLKEGYPDAFVSISDVRVARKGYFPGSGLSYPRLLDLVHKK